MLHYLIQVVDVKKNIETVQGPDIYPAAQQMLIHQGKVLKDNTTLDENKVTENSFVVIMLTKVKKRKKLVDIRIFELYFHEIWFIWIYTTEQ